MALISLTGAARRRGRPKGSGHPARLTVTLRLAYLSEDGEKIGRDRLIFRLRHDLMKQVEFRHGTKAEVLYDPETGGGVIRANPNGYSVSRVHEPNPDGKVYFPFPEDVGFPRFVEQTELTVHSVVAGELSFSVPAEARPAKSAKRGVSKKAA